MESDVTALRVLEEFREDDLHLATLLRNRQYGTLATVSRYVEDHLTKEGLPTMELPPPLHEAIIKYVDFGYRALDPDALERRAAA